MGLLIISSNANPVAVESVITVLVEEVDGYDIADTCRDSGGQMEAGYIDVSGVHGMIAVSIYTDLALTAHLVLGLSLFYI